MSQAPAPTIEQRPNRAGQPRAYIAGTRVRVQDIYALSQRERQTPERIAEALPHLSVAQIHAALAYYFAHSDEIGQELREDEQLAADLQEKWGQGPLAEKVRSE
jgi:uncharacterized protein (DUF433 family)